LNSLQSLSEYQRSIDRSNNDAFESKSFLESLEKNRLNSVVISKITENCLLYPLDVLLVGGTGTGKSSTINAILEQPVAKVGDGVDPETKSVTDYRLNKYIRFHDSAGLGDGGVADVTHARNIAEILTCRLSKTQFQYALIDLALVILDGGSRDLGTAFKLLESVVLKNISPDRVIVAINQADMAMKGRYWNKKLNEPESELEGFLNEKSTSVQRRILESTNLKIKRPIFYSALHYYNINLLMEHIIEHIPASRRKLS